MYTLQPALNCFAVYYFLVNLTICRHAVRDQSRTFVGKDWSAAKIYIHTYIFNPILPIVCARENVYQFTMDHRLRTPGEEIAFTARPKIQFQSQIFRYGRSIFCLPHWPKFSDFFDLYLHCVSVVRAMDHKIIFALWVTVMGTGVCGLPMNRFWSLPCCCILEPKGKVKD